MEREDKEEGESCVVQLFGRKLLKSLNNFVLNVNYQQMGKEDLITRVMSGPFVSQNQKQKQEQQWRKKEVARRRFLPFLWTTVCCLQ